MLRDVGRIRALKAPRIGQIDNVQASELLGIANLNLAEPIRIRNAQDLITRRTAKMKSQLEATKELHRLGAMCGKLLDADGTTVIADFYDIFGLGAPTLIDVDFPNIPQEQLLQYFQDTFLRPITIALMDGGRMTPSVQIGALASDGWWAKLMTHPGFRKIYELQQTAVSVARATNPLVQPNMWQEVDFAGIRWINYMGMRTGPVAIPANECRFFPINAPDVFRVYWASGETLLDVDKPGQPEFLYLQPDPRDQMPAYLEVVLRAYPLYACIFPKALMRARVKPAV